MDDCSRSFFQTFSFSFLNNLWIFFLFSCSWNLMACFIYFLWFSTKDAISQNHLAIHDVGHGTARKVSRWRKAIMGFPGPDACHYCALHPFCLTDATLLPWPICNLLTSLSQKPMCFGHEVRRWRRGNRDIIAGLGVQGNYKAGK